MKTLAAAMALEMALAAITPSLAAASAAGNRETWGIPLRHFG